VDVFRATPKTYAPRFSAGPGGFRGHRDGRDGVVGGPRWDRHRPGKSYPSAGAVYIGGSPYYPSYYNPFDSQIPQPVDPGPEEPEGFLRLLVSPRNARVFLDGIYEGTVDDFGGSGERVVRAGLHGVRIEADGFEPVEFDVRVPLYDTITLRRDLEPRRAPPLPPLPPPTAGPPAKPKAIYVIPRCYLGDSRPQQNSLPAGCNLADLRTLN
jgi:hypothetical protein